MRFEEKLQIRFPRKWNGWKVLFWRSLGRCPFHHDLLRSNEPYDGPQTGYGFCCDGISVQPVGFLTNLHWNYIAYKQAQEKKS